MNEFQPLIDQLYREKVLRARSMTPEERLTEGFHLTDEYLRSIAAMSEEDRQHWREAQASEEDQYYGPPMPIPKSCGQSRAPIDRTTACGRSPVIYLPQP